MPLTGFSKKVSLGIIDMTNYLMKLLNEAGFILTRSAERAILCDISEKLCYVALDPKKEKCKKNYTLPDGEILVLENELFLAPECYFNPSEIGKSVNSLDVEIFDSLMKVDDAIRGELARNIILSGKKVTGMKARLQKELEKLSTLSIEIIQAPEHSSWIGASIFGTLKHVEFPSEHWITQKEYYEHGPKIAHLKAEFILKK